MREVSPIPVVFDCTIFAQALINPSGPAGACLYAAQTGRVRVFVSAHVIQEVRELASKLPARLSVTPERVERFIFDLAKYAEPVDEVPTDFALERDPDDAAYVNLAVVSAARFLVTRDKDLLDLHGTAEFRQRFPSLQILDPPAFLREMGPATESSG